MTWRPGRLQEPTAKVPSEKASFGHAQSAVGSEARASPRCSREVVRKAEPREARQAKQQDVAPAYFEHGVEHPGKPQAVEAQRKQKAPPRDAGNGQRLNAIEAELEQEVQLREARNGQQLNAVEARLEQQAQLRQERQAD